MRSLFVDDIIGARPSHRYYEKHLYRDRHQIEIERFGPNGKDYKKSYDWYQPHKRHVEPIDRKDFPVKLFNFMHDSKTNPEDFSQSMPIERKLKDQAVAGKVTELSPRLNKSSILSGSGQNSLRSSFSSDMQSNPYFPHMYIDKNSGQKNKWTGTRQWKDEDRVSITIPKEMQIVAKSFGK